MLTTALCVVSFFSSLEVDSEVRDVLLSERTDMLDNDLNYTVLSVKV